ncbi:DUF397 domain-containing protein [Wenjunlia tyrosinilytica]|jgi:hypothetical protein|uniref:DUF397 domain-containing protein n=1 Tax=Wenjunlia tyrosinilytica TaxID=1544741 RepID=A0A917ZIQ6_9ACTN|nr:DUF397 domain-containing protein [Wenjunlia tyrosinilytica]GGO84014.1 DUF397 domain-containing protein [Wenjunlia tyrosinilytica]
MLRYAPSSAALSVERWKRSSHSTGANNCVETAVLGTEVLAVRDSKDPQGPALLFASSAWSAFVAAVRTGAFDDR